MGLISGRLDKEKARREPGICLDRPIIMGLKSPLRETRKALAVSIVPIKQKQPPIGDLFHIRGTAPFGVSAPLVISGSFCFTLVYAMAAIIAALLAALRSLSRMRFFSLRSASLSGLAS